MIGWPGRAAGAGTAYSPAGPTSRQVEFAVAACMALLRFGVVIQMVPAVSVGAQVSPEPARYVVCWSLAVGASLIVAVVSLIRRRPLPAPAIMADLALGVALVVASAATVPVGERLGSWIGWTGGYALAVAMTSAPLRSLWAWVLGVLAVIAGYLVYILPVPAHILPTVIGNVLGYAVLAATVRLVIVVVRRISRTADESQAEVARLARREEEHRAQLAFHDATTVMQLLANPSLPAALRAELQTQADTEVRRMRRYLRGESSLDLDDSRGPDEPVDLGAVVCTATEGFADLAVQTRMELVEGLTVSRSTAAALVPAIRTVLHNVRRHAHASSVIVHGDADDPSPGGPHSWKITITDDGCGFDPARTELGVGLQAQVIEELGRHAVGCRIDSATGRGTRIALQGVSS